MNHWKGQEAEGTGPNLQLKSHVYNILVLFYQSIFTLLDFPGGSVVKNPPANAGDIGSTRGSGRFPRKGNGSPLQYSCLENSMDRGAWWAIVLRVRHNWATNTFTHSIDWNIQIAVTDDSQIYYVKMFLLQRQPKNCFRVLEKEICFGVFRLSKES